MTAPAASPSRPTAVERAIPPGNWHRGALAWLCLLTLGAWSLGTGSTAQAQASPEVVASIDPAQISPGGTAVLTISVVDGRPSNSDVRPTLPDGMKLVENSPEYGEGIVKVKGEVRPAMTIAWRLTGVESGAYTIPAQEVLIRGAVYKTGATKLLIKEDPDSPLSKVEPILTLKAEKLEFYEGEVVPLSANLYIHGRTELRRPGLIELPKDNFAVQRFPLQADEEDRVSMGGAPYKVKIYNSSMSGLKPGKFKLGPATCEVLVDIYLDDRPGANPFFTQTESRKFNVVGNEIEINVLPLPAKDRPANFSGAVGEFALGLTAEPKELSVGEPISVELTISGVGNFDALSIPTLTDAKSWKLYPPRKFQPSDLSISDRGREQRIVFTQVVLPGQAVKELPVFEFSFFSPIRKKYITLRTQPVPLLVKAVAPATPEAPAPGSTGSRTAAAPTPPDKVPTVKANITDILTSTPKRPTWLAVGVPLLKDQRFLFANYIAGGALLLLILLRSAVSALHARSISPDAPARRMWKTLSSRNLSRADFYTLAVQYAAVKGVASDAIPSLVERQEQLNYARNRDEADQAVPRDERNRVLATLQGKAQADSASSGSATALQTPPSVSSPSPENTAPPPQESQGLPEPAKEKLTEAKP